MFQENHWPIGDQSRGLRWTSSSANHTAIELKASENIGTNDLKSLKALAEEGKLTRYLCVSLEAHRRQVGEVTILPVKEFLDNLWGKAHA